MVLRIATVLGALLATYWYGKAKDYGSFLTAFSFVIAYLGAETFGKKRNKARLEADLQLFNQFQSELPFDPNIRFLQNQDFAVAFVRERLNGIEDFAKTWDDESHKFLAKNLEKKKGASDFCVGS